MSESRWVQVTAIENVPLREGRAANVGGREIAIFNLGARVLAVDGRCPHKAGPLCDGIVAGSAVVCPLHAWKIDLETGVVERPVVENSCVRTYATRIVAGVISVQLPNRSNEGEAA